MGPIQRASEAVTLELSRALQPLSCRPPAELRQPRLAILRRLARRSDPAGTLLGRPNEASTALRQGISTVHRLQSVWSKLLFFWTVGLVFGTIAYMSNSTLPPIPVHIAGDLLFFIAIWPQDAHRNLLSQHDPDLWFWMSLLTAIVFGALSALAFRRLKSVGAGLVPLEPVLAQPIRK